MENILLLCCRACLKGEGGNREYYDLLGIDNPKAANTDAIKKAYKKQSLQMHPDKLAQRGVEVTAEHSLRFQKMKEAYDVLSDPRKRRLYDEIGESGLKLLESPSEINPAELIKNFQKNRGDRAKIGLAVALIFAIILLEPILFCLRCDGTITSEWLAIWAPMWGVDLILILGALFALAEKYEPPVEDEDGETTELSGSEPLHLRIFSLLHTCVFILMQIFILMRLDHRIEWSLFAVFAPWFVWEAMHALHNLPIALADIQKPEETEGMLNAGDEENNMHILMKEAKYFEKLMGRLNARKALGVQLLRVWLAIFIAVKCDGTVHWDWGLVLLPIWVYFALQLYISSVLGSWGNSMMEGTDVEAMLASGQEVNPILMVKFQHYRELKSASTAMIFFQITPLYMAILLVVRLQVVKFTTFVILLPIYIFIGCCVCGVGCGLCCLSHIDVDKMNEQMQAEQAAAGQTDGSKNSANEQKRQDESSSGTGTVYGTFHEEENKTATPIIVVTAPPPPPESSAATPPIVTAPLPMMHAPAEEERNPVVTNSQPILKETTIDADID